MGRTSIDVLFGLILLLYCCEITYCSDERNSSFCPWNCTCLGNTVDCSQKGFYTLPDNLPSWTEVLDLSSNNIEAIHVLDNFQHLKELNLNGNPLVHEHSNYCGTLNNLYALRLSNVSVNGAWIFNKLNLSCNISQLYLSNNQLREIDWSFITSFPKLTLLELSFNNFSTLDNSTLPAMVHLHSLILDDNLVNFIDKEFFNSVLNLEILKLNRNKIQSLRKNLFVGLKHLKTLELESNKLVTIEGLTFKGLESLVYLNLKRNAISQLMDGSFWGLTKIQTLDLSGNNISSVDNKWLYGLESLKQLLMAHNKIQVVCEEAWKFSKNITELNLRHNKLTSLSEPTFSELTFLRKLQLQHNNISHVDDSTFHHMSFLKALDLGFNNLSWTLDGSGMQFDNLFSLTRLVLEHNDIRFLSKRMFRDLPSLKHLNIAGGNLAYIQARAFESIQDLKYFHMDSRNLLCDCQLAWLLDWLLKNKFEVRASCGYPESLSGRQLLQLRKEELKCFSFSKPVITQEPYSVNAVLHGSINLTCVAASAGKSSLAIDWRKDNVALDSERFKEIRVKPIPTPQSSSITQVVSQIFLNPVVDDHAGVYQCIASNVIGSTYSVKAQVTVNVSPTFSKTPESNIMVRIGTTARFDCSAAGLPPPVITLQKDGGDDFPAARERRMHIYPSDERFFIVNIKPEDQGVYTCSATNPVGVISFNTSLQVLEPPKFVRRMGTNKSVIEGETTVLECQAHGTPHPKVEWLKDSKPVVLTLRHFSTGESQFLIIVQTNKNDEGEYSCIISNTLGSEKQTVYLSVVVPAIDGSMAAKTSLWDNKDDHSTTTAGIIVIAVVCCIVVTSLAWACIIYSRTRRPYVRCSFLDHQTREAIPKNNKWKDQQPNGNGADVYIAKRQCRGPTNRNVLKNQVLSCDRCAESNKSCYNHNDSGTHTMGSVSSLSKSESNPSDHHQNDDLVENKLHSNRASSLDDVLPFKEDQCLEDPKLVESNNVERCHSSSLSNMCEINNGTVPIT